MYKHVITSEQQENISNFIALFNDNGIQDQLNT